MGGGRTGRRTCPALPQRTSCGKTGNGTDKTVRIAQLNAITCELGKPQTIFFKRRPFRQTTGNRATQSQRLWGEVYRSMLVRLQPANQRKR